MAKNQKQITSKKLINSSSALPHHARFEKHMTFAVCTPWSARHFHQKSTWRKRAKVVSHFLTKPEKKLSLSLSHLPPIWKGFLGLCPPKHSPASLRRFPTSSFSTSHIFHPSHSFRYSPSSFFREIWSEWKEISSSFNPKKKKKKQYNFVVAWEICSSFSQVLRKQTHNFTPPLHLFSSNF